MSTVGGAGESPFVARQRPSLLRRTFPISEQLRGYDARSTRRDAIAGITVAALALPSAMAYAQVAGLSPVAGLYALLLPAIVYAVFGSSRQLIVGPEGALVVSVATTVAPIADGNAARYAGLAAMLAVLVGAVFVVARTIRLGWISDYFSRAVLVGYIHGIAVVLITGQLSKLLGLSISADHALSQIAEVIREIGDTQTETVIVGVVSLGVLILVRWKLPKVPAVLIVVIGGIAASAAFDLPASGVAVVGHVPAGLPSLAWPGIGLGAVLRLLPGALAIAAVGYADGILTARSFAGRHDEHVDANQELLALGAANLAAGVSQGFPVGASSSRTAVNDQMGGRTQIVGMVAAGAIAAVLLFLTGLVEKLPIACLGAVIVISALSLITPSDWRALAAVGRAETVIAAAAFGGVVIFGVLPALALACALSVIEVVTRSAHPHDAVLGYVERMGRYADVTFHPSAVVTPGVVVYRLDDRLFFANARYFKGRVNEAIAGAPQGARWLVLDAEGISDIDASGVEALAEITRTLAGSGTTLLIARLKSPMHSRFDASGLTAAIGEANFYPTVAAAVAACAGRTDRGC